MEEEIIIIEEIDEEEFVVVEDDIEYISPTTQEKIIMPKTEQQIVVPDDGVFALSKVTVEAVTNEIDENIKPSNIKLGVSILGVEGNVEPDKPDQTKEVTPTREAQTITADTGYELASVKVEAIPSNYVEVAGTIDITTNGVHNVSEYENANVNVGGIVINDASYLFYLGARTDVINELCACISEENTSCQYMCQYCSNLIEVPPHNTGKATSMYRAYANCSKLTTVSELDCGSVLNIQFIFASSSALVNLGGFKDLGKAYSTTASAGYSYYTLELAQAKNLTYESMMNVINGLYDIASKGCNAQELWLPKAGLGQLSDAEKAIVTDKGWSLNSY